MERLAANSLSVVPMKVRRSRLIHPLEVHAICNYKQLNLNIEKGQICTLIDNSQHVKWKVTFCSNRHKGCVHNLTFVFSRTSGGSLSWSGSNGACSLFYGPSALPRGSRSR